MTPGGGGSSGTIWALSQRLVREGMTFERAWALLRDAGLPTTRDNFLSIWTPATGAPEARRQQQRLADDLRPTAREIVDSPLHFDVRYAYRVLVQGIHRLTGGGVSQYVTVLTNRLMTKADAAIEAMTYALLDPASYELEPTSAQVELVERSAP